jgi:hypothetical protein
MKTPVLTWEQSPVEWAWYAITGDGSCAVMQETDGTFTADATVLSDTDEPLSLTALRLANLEDAQLYALNLLIDVRAQRDQRAASGTTTAILTAMAVVERWAREHNVRDIRFFPSEASITGVKKQTGTGMGGQLMGEEYSRGDSLGTAALGYKVT